MSCGETHERVIHDDQIVSIQVLLNRGFTKLAQGSAVPLNISLRVLVPVLSDPGE